MADKNTFGTQNSVANEVRQNLGQAVAGDGKETIKTPILSFSDSNVYLGLKLVSRYDEKTNTHRDPVPKITCSFKGQFVEVPTNGKWWRQFADFCDKMAIAMEGVDLETSRISDDVDYAKTMMAKFKNKAA